MIIEQLLKKWTGKTTNVGASLRTITQAGYALKASNITERRQFEVLVNKKNS